jgi:hypothetical protein
MTDTERDKERAVLLEELRLSVALAFHAADRHLNNNNNGDKTEGDGHDDGGSGGERGGRPVPDAVADRLCLVIEKILRYGMKGINTLFFT